MMDDLQKASMWKRISAFLFDVILLGITVVLFAWALSAALGFDRHYDRLNACYAQYEEAYGVSFQLSLSEYEALTDAERETLLAAYDALSADADANYAYQMMLQLSVLITSLSILLGYGALEFAVPLALKHGRTLGKRIFGLSLMQTNGVKVGAVQMFIRTFLGKYAIETMIPALILIMIYWNVIGVVGPVVLALIALLQLILLIATRTNSPIHDLMAGTVVVDYASQMIFDSREAMIAYKEKKHAEAAAIAPY